MEYMRHFGIIPIFVLIQLKHSLVVRINLRLVEYAQYFLQSIVYPSSQPRNLDNDAVMLQTLYKWVWLLLVYFISLIVIYLMSGIDDGFRELSHVMPQQIHRHGRQGILALGLLAHILLVVILHSQVLAEAQGFRLQPCFLQFYQNQILTAVIFQYGCIKVNTKHRDGITGNIGILMTTHFYSNHRFLQECRKQSLGYSLIFHHILEDGIVKWVGYVYHHILSSMIN